MSEELYNSNDFCKLAEEFEELKKENAELARDKDYLMNLFMERSEYVFNVVANMKIESLTRKCKALEADYAVSNREMLLMQVEIGELKSELARRDEELALTEKKLCNIDRSARVEVARRDEIIKQQGEVSVIFQEQLSRRDEIIKRLREDAERLAIVETEMTGYEDEYEEVYCLHSGSCGSRKYQKDVEFIHTPNCPITLHRALMKELE